ncbi:MAG: Ribosomal RNA large subunit methyltransferase K [Syntrophorhabdaceae bacterium PtaU1.Bin034]|nr:MAG: Ribosomal RNA large subunit methyltransferase K [Syntrophorhabdaceae bacterium PtaU1.Bin034]
MGDYKLIAATTFGIEAIVAEELRSLGYRDLTVENGRVSFEGNARDIAACNIRLRTADRVMIKMAEFKATDFEELFQGTRKVGWEDFIPVHGKMHVVGKSHKSALFSVPDCQSIVKKAIVEAMKRRYRQARFEETGPVYKVEVALLNDTATLTLDTSGPGLHKRGYRVEKGEAPIRETLAAALVKLSRWQPGREFADPFCGSGTIAIEAALIGRNQAPGINRTFVSEDWPHIGQGIWKEAREEARSAAAINEVPFRILASDVDGSVLKIARENAGRAGVSEVVSFQKQEIGEFRSRKKYGCMVCNPPYGERTGGQTGDVEKIYRVMGEVYSRLDAWSLFTLTSHPFFEKAFGRKADRKRKLYNGNILCHLYQYFGALPGKKQEAEKLRG